MTLHDAPEPRTFECPGYVDAQGTLQACSKVIRDAARCPSCDDRGRVTAATLKALGEALRGGSHGR